MLNKERDAELERRIHMLVLLKNGECRKRKEIANRLAVHRNTIKVIFYTTIQSRA